MAIEHDPLDIIETQPPQDPAPAPAPAPDRKPVEAWRDARGTPAWLFAAAKAYRNWPIGRELTEAEYDSAISDTKNIGIGR